MTESLLYPLILLSALGAGLIAGAFFAFSTFVMAALNRLPAAQGIAAMQSINIAVINPVFLGLFMGTALTCAVMIPMAFLHWGMAGAVFLVVGSAFYLLGTFLVTLAFNVPLNNALAAVAADSAAGAELWKDYLKRWTFWNHIRALAALLGSGSFMLAFRAM
jgi:uncharacterized membrane protein